ncbi:MAG: hypothetical protein AABX27_05995 [Nanoarchaeota archaeon]
MALISEIKKEWEKEDGSIDLDNPLVIAFRKANLETLAKEQKSNLYCPYCEIHLPYTMETLGGQAPTGKRDAYGQQVFRSALYCPLCERYFDKEPEQLSLFTAKQL